MRFSRMLAGLSLLASSTLLAQSPIEIEEAYVRAVPPTQANTAAFMRLINTSDQDISLVAAQAAASAVTELHTHLEVEGVMQMRQIDQIIIPAQGQAELRPGGLHVMLIGLNKALTEGEMTSLQLRFSDDSNIEIELPVKSVMSGMMQHGHHGQHKH